MQRSHFIAFLMVVLLGWSAPNTALSADKPAKIEDFSENSLIIASAKYLGATAESMAEVIDRIFSRYGTPQAVIRGEEVSVAAMLGARYGRGTVSFPDGREVPIYWRGPSAGLDMGATGTKSFALVYNIKEPTDLHRRFFGVDGSLIALGGVAFNYLQRNNTVIAPMRVGVGYQVGVSLGYLKYSPKTGWMPF